MRVEFRTLTRTICALVLVLVLGGVTGAMAQGRGRHRGWTQGRHRGWDHSRYYRRTNNTRLARRELLLRQRLERRSQRGAFIDPNGRRELLRRQRAERREFRSEHGRGHGRH